MREGAPDDLTPSTISSASPCQALTSDWWVDRRDRWGKSIQCSRCPARGCLGTARLAGEGAPGEGVPMPLDPLTSIQDEREGSGGEVAEAQRLWLGTGSDRDPPRQHSTGGAVISGGLGWAGGWSCQQRVTSESPAHPTGRAFASLQLHRAPSSPGSLSGL